jgi:hypothetical protein
LEKSNQKRLQAQPLTSLLTRYRSTKQIKPMAFAMQTLNASSIRPSVAARPSSVFRQCRQPALPLRSSRIVTRAEKQQAENPLDQAAIDFEKKVVDPIVEKTKENSGLDEAVFNKTAKSAQNDDVGAFAETMSFAGLAPEIINGRGAMVGILTAFFAEINTGAPVFSQIQKTPGAILLTFGTIILASVIPIIRGADLNRKGAGPFTPRAEVWNGRLAMVSFAALIAIETFKAGPGFVWW